MVGTLFTLVILFSIILLKPMFSPFSFFSFVEMVIPCGATRAGGKQMSPKAFFFVG